MTLATYTPGKERQRRLDAALAVARRFPSEVVPAARPAGQGVYGERLAAPVETLPGGRDDLVTRPVCLTGETFEAAAPFFVDWLTIAQEHPQGGLPRVEAGMVWCVDEEGEVEWQTSKAVKHVGSWETSLAIKCDGFRVCLSGNVGRFGRPDNVWGFDLAECIRKANEVLAHYGLPPFTAGKRFHRITKKGVRFEWTGARISRIDLTKNYFSGSAENLTGCMQFLQTQHKDKQRGRTHAEAETVDWGRGSRRQYWKAYAKWRELKAHGCQDARLVDYCRDNGLLRFEGTIRSNALTDLGCAFLGDYVEGWAMPQLIRLFEESAQILTRAQKVTDDLDSLPRPLRATARDYLAGMDVCKSLSRATYYRHRKELLPYGIDIAMTNVAPFKPRVQVIELRPAVKPDWYQLAA